MVTSMYEQLLPLNLIRNYTKTDDDFFVTDDELRLLRSAAFKELAKYNKSINLEGVKNIEQQVLLKMSAAGYVFDQKVSLTYPVSSPFVTVTFYNNLSINVKCAYNSRFIYLAFRDQTVNLAPCTIVSPSAILYYTTGTPCPETLDESIALGCLKFIDAALIEKSNPTKFKSLVFDSGAHELWK